MRDFKTLVTSKKSSPLFTRINKKETILLFLRFRFHLCIWDSNPGRQGTLGCLLHQSPKFFNNVFLFIGWTTLGTFIKFWLVGSFSWVPKSIQSQEWVILCIIIGDVHKFIDHCLIPLDPWFETEVVKPHGRTYVQTKVN